MRTCVGSTGLAEVAGGARAERVAAEDAEIVGDTVRTRCGPSSWLILPADQILELTGSRRTVCCNPPRNIINYHKQHRQGHQAGKGRCGADVSVAGIDLMHVMTRDRITHSLGWN